MENEWTDDAGKTNSDVNVHIQSLKIDPAVTGNQEIQNYNEYNTKHRFLTKEHQWWCHALVTFGLKDNSSAWLVGVGPALEGNFVESIVLKTVFLVECFNYLPSQEIIFNKHMEVYTVFLIVKLPTTEEKL